MPLALATGLHSSCSAVCSPWRPPPLQALEQHAAALGIPRTLYMPKVTQSVLIEHRAERTAKVVGRLGEKAARLGQPVRGLLVQGRGGARTLLHHEDLPRFTKLHPGRVVQRQALALHRPFSEVRLGWVAAKVFHCGRLSIVTCTHVIDAQSAPNSKLAPAWTAARWSCCPAPP